MIILLVIIIVTGWLLYRVMAGFLLPLFLAAVLAVIFRPVHTWVFYRFKGRPYLSAGLTTTAILLVVLVPFCGVLALAVHEGLDAVSGDVLEKTGAQLSQLRRRVGLSIPFAQFSGRPNDTTYALQEVTRQVKALPDRLSSPAETSGSEVDQVRFVRDALQALQAQLGKIAAQLSEHASPEDSVEMQRVRRLMQQAPDDPFRPLNEMVQTLEESVAYLEERPISSKLDQEKDAGGQADLDAQQAGINQVAGLRTQYMKLKASYDSFRIDLLGGTFWGGLTELANPNARQIETLRASFEKQLRGSITSVAGQATAIVGSFALGLAIMTISIFYFLKDGPGMIRTLMRLSPLDDRYELQLITEFDSVSRAVVLATLLSAVAQGFLAGLGYFFASLDSVVLLTMLTMLFALVPFVGAAAIWVPAAFWLAFVEQRFPAAIVLFIYGATIVSMADNIVKPYVLHGQSKLHPLLALLSVLGGVQALGPIGILVGPMVVSFLQALLNILNQELTALTPATAELSENAKNG